jgi:hypothetical protein
MSVLLRNISLFLKLIIWFYSNNYVFNKIFFGGSNACIAQYKYHKQCILRRFTQHHWRVSVKKKTFSVPEIRTGPQADAMTPACATPRRGLKVCLHEQCFSVSDATAASATAQKIGIFLSLDVAVASDTEKHCSCKQTIKHLLFMPWWSGIVVLSLLAELWVAISNPSGYSRVVA